MFGLSWAETFVILVVALLVIKPQDIPGIVKGIRGFFQKCKQLRQEISSSVSGAFDQEEFSDLKKEAQAINKDINYLVDMDGNLQETYDVKKLLDEEQQSVTPPSETKHRNHD